MSSAPQNPAYDCRIGAGSFGLLNHDEFYSLPPGHLREQDVTRVFGQEAAKFHASHYQAHFTHADLALRHTIVRYGSVVAIIKWGSTG